MHATLLLFALALQQAPTPLPPGMPLKPAAPELRAHPEWPEARVADVDTPRDIVAAFFQAISAAKGGTLDRERLRSLFTPTGRIEIPIPGSDRRATDVLFMSPDQYAAMSDGATAQSGFFDHLLALHLQQFGTIAHAWTAYESRNAPNDAKPFVRGIKTFDLLNSGGRWYITQVAWDRERTNNIIPPQYLQDEKP